jgi:hypothetical protein
MIEYEKKLGAFRTSRTVAHCLSLRYGPVKHELEHYRCHLVASQGGFRDWKNFRVALSGDLAVRTPALPVLGTLRILI